MIGERMQKKTADSVSRYFINTDHTGSVYNVWQIFIPRKRKHNKNNHLLKMISKTFYM